MLGRLKPTGNWLLTGPPASLAAAAGMSRKPLPRSTRPELSAKALGLPESASALRIWVAEAAGNFWRRRAAVPATVGDENEVPETREMPPFADWAKVAKPLAETATWIRPSGVGPRELNVAVCRPENGRQRS